MKNYEKYADKIKNYGYDSFCDDFIQPYILKQNGCDMDCEQCNMIQMIWLMKEYEEPKVDWSKVEVDTPIFVKNSEDEMWRKRHFAKYENGIVYAWGNGFTSWTENYMASWKYAKLAESEEECEEPKIDWSQIEVDTPIMVRYSETGKWKKRYFAKFEDGIVYAWNNGETSLTTESMTDWNYAKLAEDEKELEVDWSKVEVDTPVLVRDREDTESAFVPWFKRYFAEYKDGLVYTWVNGRTSWNEDKMHGWNYAKLAESEEE